LLLMCYAHHVETNDVATFTVGRMEEIKDAHEARFRLAVDRIAASIEDTTKKIQPTNARTLARANRELGWNNSEGELLASAEELKALVAQLKVVPIDSRALLAIIVERAREDGGERVLYSEIVHAVRDEDAVRTHVEILESHSLIWVDVCESYAARIVIPTLKSGWPIWQDLRTFCEKQSLALTSFAVDLRFDLLDG
jgi:hypothetical protein